MLRITPMKNEKTMAGKSKALKSVVKKGSVKQPANKTTTIKLKDVPKKPDKTDDGFFAEKRSDIFFVDPRTIDADESFNIRDDYGDIEDLSKSIVQNGVKRPLTGRRGKVVRNGKEVDGFILTDGFRRMRAITIGINQGHIISRVPFMLEPKGYNDLQRLFDMYILNDSKRLTVYEEAKLFTKALSQGLSQKEIALEVGKTDAAVSNMIQGYKKASADPVIKNAIKENKISMSFYIEHMRPLKSEEEISKANLELRDQITTLVAEGKTKITQKDIMKPTSTLLSGTSGKSKTSSKKDTYRPSPSLSTAMSPSVNADSMDALKALYDSLLEQMGVQAPKLSVLKFIVNNFGKVSMSEIIESFKEEN